jgi:acylphosphatase
MKTRVHVVVSGKVQGVWYRASTKQKADELGLTGWVKNTANGDVEGEFEGDDSIIHEMIAWCRKGPSLAQVSDVKVTPKQYVGTFSGFTIFQK